MYIPLRGVSSEEGAAAGAPAGPDVEGPGAGEAGGAREETAGSSSSSGNSSFAFMTEMYEF